MRPALPLCSSPAAFGLLSEQIRSLESTEALLAGAVAISMHQMPNVSLAQVDKTIQGYADNVRKRVRGCQPQALLAHLHEYLFDELGFTGNRDDYYNARNSYLPAVLETKRGLPITLSLLYKLVGRRLGIRVHGIGLPGHFLVAVETGETANPSVMLVDPFNSGHVITPDEVHERLRENFGPELELTEDMFRPVSNIHWLTRMLQNLLHVFGRHDRFADVAAMLEMEMLLWPKQCHLQRDLGLVLARIGMSRPASAWLCSYLASNPDDPQEVDLKQLLAVLET
jgi:regulator of sirC expression with transglutaminase-like and TPR domain